MGLNVKDFDVITLYQFKVLQERYWKHLKNKKEIDSLANFYAIINAHRDKNQKYQKLWGEEEKSIEQSLDDFNTETEALLDW